VTRRLASIILASTAIVGVLYLLRPGRLKATAVANQAPVIRYTDVASRAGLHFKHDNAATPQKYLIETMGAGSGWIDYDNDGLLDIYLIQGADTPVYKALHPLRSALYRNNGDGTFTDVTSKSGINEKGRFATSAGWFDYDNDGLLDLFICHYVQWSPETDQSCGEHRPGYRSYCHPDNYPPDKNRLFRNNGDGTFSDVTEKSGVGRLEGKALGVVLADFNNDGWMDIFVANDAWRNFLFLNNRDGTFRDATMSSGVGYSLDGALEAGMGVDAADVNHDGWMDVYVTHLDRELNRLYLSNHDGTFLDATYQTGLGNHARVYSGFGTKFLDYDQDGFPDILVANGHIMDNVPLYNAAVTYAEPKLMYRNDGRGKFKDASASLGPDFLASRVSRGVAVGDFDNDGDLDILISNNGQAPQLLRCDIANPNDWVALRLIGTHSNRQGIGARIKVVAGDLVQYAQSMGGTSYCSSHDPRIFFGLGKKQRIDSIEVRWPSGIVDRLRNIAPNRFLVLREGEATAN
jgi:hypothetical protein